MMKPEERLEEIGWEFDEYLMKWHYEDRYVGFDGKYVNISIYDNYDEEYHQGYLTYQELVLFGKLIEEEGILI